jgi:hypothetical protein
LLPQHGKKAIGRLTRPTTKGTLPTRKAATVLKDAVNFHGARLSVEVLNQHKSKLFRSHEVTIAADRLVELHEGDTVCKFDDFTLRARFGRRERGSEPPFGDFAFEMPRRILKQCPVMLETNRKGEFVGLVVFKPGEKQRGRVRGAGNRVRK